AVLADFADELAVAVELKQPRAAMGERARGSNGDGRMAGPRIDEDIALGVRGDASDLAQVDVVGQVQQVGDRIKGDLRRSLSGYRLHAKRGSGQQEQQKAFHGAFSSSGLGPALTAPLPSSSLVA